MRMRWEEGEAGMRSIRCEGRAALSVLVQAGTKAHYYGINTSHARIGVFTGVSYWEQAWLLHSLGAQALLQVTHFNYHLFHFLPLYS